MEVDGWIAQKSRLWIKIEYNTHFIVKEQNVCSIIIILSIQILIVLFGLLWMLRYLTYVISYTGFIDNRKDGNQNRTFLFFSNKSQINFNN